MKLNEIFAKDIQRPIEGVIKADDSSHLATEIEEYVLTNEAAKSIEQFLETYTKYTNSNGVWISGFFGSGKSHLLKMLAHLLGNVDGQEFPREKVSASFADKVSDAFLPGLLLKTAKIPSKSLLFNIDQKATLISRDQSDALLKVFVKVFDESCGYYGNQGHIAQFERHLDSRGQYQSFKDVYKKISGRDWLKGREEGILEEANVAKAYAEISGQQVDAPTNILTKYRNEYSVSIEDFANEVHAWLNAQESDFRLNFFVDEVGQFIGSDTSLMLNLQTIAESLNTKCQGRAWIIVTSQEDMEKIVGDRTKSQGNDFSKIQARFATRMKLTSADVEEVIRKRLLEKNSVGYGALKDIYASQSANFKTLFDFVDGAKTYRNYTDESHFIGTYPFVTYQFPLFQAAIVGISDHNIFEGKNSSVGERSMLGVVQLVSKDIDNLGIGMLATFDQMFAGIRSSLKSASQKSIEVAERNVNNPLAVKLLKALFLVKYVEGFNATSRNLLVLMYDKFGLDLPALSKRVEEALALLETQTYIQRNGNTYEYLTNEEQVIEAEIKEVDLDASEISQRLFKLISDVIKGPKIRYAKNGQDFSFGSKLDDQPYGKQQELSLHFISPNYDTQNVDDVRIQSAGRDELRVILGDDARLISDLRLLLKTEKYTKRKSSMSMTPEAQRILSSKAAFNSEREKELVERLKKSLGASTLYVNATLIEPTSQDAVTRITEGFQTLVGYTYSQLSILGGVTYSEGQIADFANPNAESLIDEGPLLKLTPAADDVLSFITRQELLGAKVTVKAIVDYFEAKSYGWYLAAIQVCVARLVGISKVIISLDGNIVKRTEIAALLRNTQKHAHAIVSIQKQYDEHKVAKFREFCTAFFDDAQTPKDPLELVRYASDRFQALKNELTARLENSTYPFVKQLQDPATLIMEVTGHSTEWYFEEFSSRSIALLAAKENIIDPVRAFLAGPQKDIYDAAVGLLTVHANNLAYIEHNSAPRILEILAEPNAFRGSHMQQLKAQTSELQKVIEEAIRGEQKTELDAIDSRTTELVAGSDFISATIEAQQSVLKRIEEIKNSITAEVQIALLRQVGSNFQDSIFPSLLTFLYASSHTDSPAQIETVSINKIDVIFIKHVLSDPEDVKEYLDAYRAELLKAINEGKRISL